MREIDNYIDLLYKNFDKTSEINEELKEEMKSHLIDTVEELKEEGFSEKESIKIALDRFGEISEIRGELKTVAEKGIRPLIYTLSISLGILVMFFMFLYLNIERLDYVKLPALMMVAVPMYIIIRTGILITYKIRGIYCELNWKKEIYKFLFSTYLIFLVGWYIFPIDLWSDGNINFQMDLIPFKDFIDLINNGLTPVSIVKGILFRIILFMPLGFYPLFLKGKFKNTLTCILLGSLIYFIVPVLEFLLSFRIISVPVIYIGIDYWIISVFGVLFGYFVYNRLRERRV